MRAIIGLTFLGGCAVAVVVSCSDDSSTTPTPFDAGTPSLDAALADGSPSPDGAPADAGAKDAAPDAVTDAAVDADAATDSGCANAALVQSTFTKCDASATHVGQFGDAPGVTCNDVCCTFGFAGCAYRAAQSGLNACNPGNPGDSGTCTDIFQTTWSSQCVCTQ